MTKFKRFAALAAVMMLGIQILGAGTAFAGSPHSRNPGGTASSNPSDCDFGSDNLEVTIDDDDVAIRVNDNGALQCDASYNTSGSFSAETGSLPAVSVDSLTVEMDNEDSLGQLTILLDDGGSTKSTSEWPAFGTFDIDLATVLHVDGSGVTGTTGRDSQRIVATSSSLSFSGTRATSNAPAYTFKTGSAADSIDASKVTVKVTADGGAGSDLIKGGSGNDSLVDNGLGADVIYGNGGNDDIDCGASESGTQGWGGDGLDDIRGCKTAAPGAGDDVVADAVTVTYADLKEGIEYDGGSTDGAAGDDTIPTSVLTLVGSQGDDVIVDPYQQLETVYGGLGDDAIKVSQDNYDSKTGVGAYVYGGAGNDFVSVLDFEYNSDPAVAITTEDHFYGGAGDDILKGKAGNDVLRGGPGKDQAWGGSGSEDFCAAEVTNRCEYGKVA